jgi:hypothetical protein
MLRLRLLAEIRVFRHAETAKTAKTRYRQTTKNAETAEIAKTVSAFQRSMSYDIHIVLAF